MVLFHFTFTVTRTGAQSQVRSYRRLESSRRLVSLAPCSLLRLDINCQIEPAAIGDEISRRVHLRQAITAEDRFGASALPQ